MLALPRVSVSLIRRRLLPLCAHSTEFTALNNSLHLMTEAHKDQLSFPPVPTQKGTGSLLLSCSIESNCIQKSGEEV